MGWITYLPLIPCCFLDDIVFESFSFVRRRARCECRTCVMICALQSSTTLDGPVSFAKKPTTHGDAIANVRRARYPVRDIRCLLRRRKDLLAKSDIPTARTGKILFVAASQLLEVHI